jgi:hypothetical protein
MENKGSSTLLRNFVIKVIVVDIGLIVLAGFTSISYDLNFGIILLLLGIVMGGIGNVLAGPTLVNRQGARDLKYSNRPNEALSNRISDYLAHAIPHYGFENVMIYSGLAAIVISIPFLILLMFSK